MSSRHVWRSLGIRENKNREKSQFSQTTRVYEQECWSCHGGHWQTNTRKSSLVVKSGKPELTTISFLPRWWMCLTGDLRKISHCTNNSCVCWVCLQILAGITRYASNPSVGNHKRTGIHKICKFTQQYECLTWLSQWVVTLTEQLFLFSEKSDSWKCTCVKLTRRERLQRKCTPFVWAQWTISTCIGWLRFDSWGAQTLINSCECRTRLFIPLLLACSILTPQNIGG